MRRNVSAAPDTIPIYSDESTYVPMPAEPRGRKKRVIFGFFAFLARVLGYLMPKRWGAADTEANSPSRAHTATNALAHTTLEKWRTVISYICVIVTCCVLIFFSVAQKAPDDFFNSRARAESLMKHCKNHADRLAILNEAAVELSMKHITSGFLPCGTPIETLKRKLIKLHMEHGSKHCLTAKHLNHSLAIISVKESTGSIRFMFNPIQQEFTVIGKNKTTELESSDFFPQVGEIAIERPVDAFVSWYDSSGTRIRRHLSGATLRCVMGAWEVLTGEHAERFQLLLNATI